MTTNTANLYPGKKATDVVEVPCSRCGGGAAATDWGYGLVTNVLAYDGSHTGRLCFKCAGRGTETRTVGSLRKAARAAARRDAKRIAEAEARRDEEAKAEAARIAHEAEVAAAREAERLAADPVPVTDIRQVITGEIVSLKNVESHFGYRTTVTTKMLVKDDRGFKVWGTCPPSIIDALYDAWWSSLDEDDHPRNYGSEYYFKHARGTRVTFAAMITPSDDDDRFGFFKRPTKASIA